MHINELRPEWNGQHFADNIFTCIFLVESYVFWMKILLKSIPKGLIDSQVSISSDNVLLPSGPPFTNMV